MSSLMKGLCVYPTDQGEVLDAAGQGDTAEFTRVHSCVYSKVLEIVPRALRMLGKYSITELQPQSWCLFFYEKKSLKIKKGIYCPSCMHIPVNPFLTGISSEEIKGQRSFETQKGS